MPVHLSPAASALADIGHLLESVEMPSQQLERALVLLGRLVPYDRCALLDAWSSASPGVVVVPEASGEVQEHLRGRLAVLHDLVSDRPAAPARPLRMPGSAAGPAHLAVPVIALDKAIGVLMVEKSGEAYEEHHLQLLSIVAAQVGGYLTNVRLQSEGKRATQAMQRAADLLEYIKDGFLELDATRACVTANRAAVEMLGSPHDQLLRVDAGKLPGIGGSKSFLAGCERALRERVPVHVDAERCGEGDRWFEFEFYPTELGVSVFLRDVSERRAAEEFRELLTGIIGHDLRTPLGAITMTASTLLRRGGLDGPTAQSVARIASSGARMSELVSQLLDLTRIRSGKGLPIQRTEADLGQVCRDVASEISAANPARQIECQVQGDLRGSWDVPRLSQVVSNLVANAVQHGEPGSPVRVAARPVEDGRARIEVHNEGAPIPAEMLPIIFEPFRQAGGNVVRAGGLGLGLFIAQSVVRAHGGAIEVQSTAAAGTTFSVLLPRGESIPVRQSS